MKNLATLTLAMGAMLASLATPSFAQGATDAGGGRHLSSYVMGSWNSGGKTTPAFLTQGGISSGGKYLPGYANVLHGTESGHGLISLCGMEWDGFASQERESISGQERGGRFTPMSPANVALMHESSVGNGRSGIGIAHRSSGSTRNGRIKSGAGRHSGGQDGIGI